MQSPKEMQLQPQDEEDNACIYAMQLASACALPMTLTAALHLKLLDAIVEEASTGGGKLSASEIAANLPAENPQAAMAVDRMLRLLASYNIVSCEVEDGVDGAPPTRKYGVAPVTKLLSRGGSDSVAALAIMQHDKIMMESWYHLKDTVLEGGAPFIKAHGMTLFQCQSTNSHLNKIFNEAMHNSSIPLVNKFLNIYRGFDTIKVLVDLGGGTGAILKVITSSYPHIKGINFDLPHVVSQAPSIPGVEHIGGDMFQNVPSSDTIFMKWILHDWGDEQCVMILENCWKALQDNGKVLVMDCVLQEVPTPTPMSQNVHHYDLLMLAYSSGGKERTLREFDVLAKKAGFSYVNATYIFAYNWIIELVKKCKE